MLLFETQHYRKFTILAKGSNSFFRLMYTVQFVLTAFCENFHNSFFNRDLNH